MQSRNISITKPSVPVTIKALLNGFYHNRVYMKVVETLLQISSNGKKEKVTGWSPYLYAMKSRVTRQK